MTAHHALPAAPIESWLMPRYWAGSVLRSWDQMAKTHAPSETKFFVLDTNVLLHNPNALFAFKDNHVVIPFDVLEELDKFKKDTTDVGRSARTAIRFLDTLREKGHLTEGVGVERPRRDDPRAHGSESDADSGRHHGQAGQPDHLRGVTA